MIIYKYKVDANRINNHRFDKNSKVLHLDFQYGLYIWVLHPDNAVMDTPRRIGVWGTGIFIGKDRLDYINTIQTPANELFHCFEHLPEICGL